MGCWTKDGERGRKIVLAERPMCFSPAERGKSTITITIIHIAKDA